MTTRRKLALLASLYFCQGLPFGFFTQAVPTMLRARGASLQLVGLSSSLAVPWMLKFLWAPLVDRTLPGAARLGRRRAVILPLQAGSVLLLGALALVDPAASLLPLAAGTLLTNLLAATQDIATDALAIDVLASGERGLGNGIQVAGYRVGMMVGGGAILAAWGLLAWSGSVWLMAGLLLAGSLPILFWREPPAPPEDGRHQGLGFWAHAFSSWARQPGIGRWLIVLLVWKAGESLATAMLRPMLVDRGLGLPDIGRLVGTVGSGAGLLGALVGGLLPGALGRRRALLAAGVTQSLAVAAYAGVAGGSSEATLYAVIGGEHLASGMATVALFTIMMDACRASHPATDYTVQASVVVMATGAAANVSGFVAAAVGYGPLFLIGAAVSLVAVGTAARITLPAPHPSTSAAV